MKNNVYAVFDSCSSLFGDPFIATNDAVAKRLFVNTLSQPSVPKYIRDDAVLYGVGFFDNQTGYFTTDDFPYVVARGSSVIVPRETSVTEVSELEE